MLTFKYKSFKFNEFLSYVSSLFDLTNLQFNNELHLLPDYFIALLSKQIFPL